MSICRKHISRFLHNLKTIYEYMGSFDLGKHCWLPHKLVFSRWHQKPVWNTLKYIGGSELLRNNTNCWIVFHKRSCRNPVDTASAYIFSMCFKEILSECQTAWVLKLLGFSSGFKLFASRAMVAIGGIGLLIDGLRSEPGDAIVKTHRKQAGDFNSQIV